MDIKPENFTCMVNFFACDKNVTTPPPRAESGWHLYCTVQRLVLLSHLNTAKLFNDYILFQEYTPVWALKQVFFFFQTFCYIIIPISGIMGHYSMIVNYNKNQKKIN